ncbi:hypothetical protein [Grimontia hollisae]|uniref:hypothetical protein n=1 Tax=Grimontia hollisae TaxID=673 RepID=UPI001303D2BA|nr:hypothetical protein [Grimontia hollisae]
MLKVKFREDGTECTTEQYEHDPDKYRGLIDCIQCGRQAWFIKSYKTPKIERTACFAARHTEGCDASTVVLAIDDEDKEAGGDLDKDSSDIRVDLDKSSGGSIYVSTDSKKHSDEESSWVSSAKQKAIGNSSGFPLNKSLRQLLTNLCRNPQYGEPDKSIHIVAESGRTVIEGLLKDKLVHFSEITKEHEREQYIFWGELNNANVKDETLYLNVGDFRKEPSIVIEEPLKSQVRATFRLKDFEELNGADALIVGVVGFSSNGKAVLRTGFPKYMAFRVRKVVYN